MSSQQMHVSIELDDETFKVDPMDSGSPQFIWLDNQRYIIGVTLQNVAAGSFVSPASRSQVLNHLGIN